MKIETFGGGDTNTMRREEVGSPESIIGTEAQLKKLIDMQKEVIQWRKIVAENELPPREIIELQEEIDSMVIKIESMIGDTGIKRALDLRDIFKKMHKDFNDRYTTSGVKIDDESGPFQEDSLTIDALNDIETAIDSHPGFS